MHRALHVPELVHMILGALDPDRDKDTLVSVAQTCRALFFPAVCMIWKNADISSLAHLTNTVLGLRHDRKNNDRTPARECLSRFQQYAGAIQSLHIASSISEDDEEDDKIRIEDTAIQSLAYFHHCPSALPNLQTLSACAEELRHLKYAMLFLTPAIQDISLECNNSGAETDDEWILTIGYFLELVRLRVKKLKEFDFMLSLSETTSEFRFPLELILAMSSVEVFHSDAVWEPLVLTAIGDLPSLSELSLKRTRTGPTHLDLSAMDPSSFKSLLSLTLHCDIMSATEVLRCVTAKLERLALELDCTRAEVTELQSLLTRMASKQSNLARLCLTIFEGGPVHDDPFQWCYCKPILQCRAVTHLALDVQTKSALDFRDEHVKAIAAAMPGLQELRLDWLKGVGKESGLQDTTALTLSSLGSLGSYCPNLRGIFLASIDAGTVPPPFPSLLRTHTVKLAVGPSPRDITNPDLVAAYLGAIWQSVELTPLAHLCEEKENAEWTTVGNMLRSIRFLRIMEAFKQSPYSSFGERFPLEYRSALSLQQSDDARS